VTRPTAPRYQERPEERSVAAFDGIYVHRTGFREYDARWRLDRDVNLRGLTRVGHSFGALLHELDPAHREIVLGHDYRSYSLAAAQAVALGLVASGLLVRDIGLCVTPMAYFAQHLLGIRALAQITASHNENGWTGVKMGQDLSCTLEPDQMSRLKELALFADLPVTPGGGIARVEGVRAAYLRDLVSGGALRKRRRVLVATGNGTAGAFAPEALAELGCDVVPLHTDLDWTFPNGNPNPESEAFLSAMRDAVRRAGARSPCLGLGFDGDGDRIGVVDESGRSLYSDKVGLLLARWMAPRVADPRFVVDVKCTSLLDDKSVLPAEVHWEKTGHSYIKSAVARLGATAGFERSGHFFFRSPFGRGYDDGLVSAILLLRMLDDLDRPLFDLVDELPLTWQSPNYQPFADDARKYAAVAEITATLRAMATGGDPLARVAIRDVVTINGARAVCQDGSWLLVRASSNRPSLVVMAESRSGPERLDALIDAARRLLARVEGVGPMDEASAG
jgi:phosphomannomutase / phosphoglucomutase